MTPAEVSAVIVTRGDVNLGPVLASLSGFGEILVWDNTRMQEHGYPDYRVFGRYEAARSATYPVIYTQDDDVIVDAAAVVRQYDPNLVVCNMPAAKRPEYPDRVALVGWGAVFAAGKFGAAFARYLHKWPADELFRRECDRVFTGLSQVRRIDVPFQHLPHAYCADRMGAEKRHGADLQEIRKRIRAC